MALPSILQHSFAQVPQAEIERSSFDRSHGHKTTFNAGNLIPIYVDEALPGDTFNLKMTAFCRLATPLKPIMDNMYLDSFFFFVPNRLVWTNFQKFMGQQDNPGDSISYLVPTVTSPAGGPAVGSLADYFGVPTAGQITGSDTLTYSALPHRCYNLIYNEWFRDENLQNSVTVDKGDGPDTYADYVLLKAGKRHDYFTSCLPWPQKGPSVEIPLGTKAPITGIGKENNSYASSSVSVYESGGNVATYTKFRNIDPASTSNNFFVKEDPDHAGYPGIYADLSSATAATINALRQSFQIQRLYERDARGGTRYTEIIRAHFFVVSPDARLQRPEYLGGGSVPINVYPVAQTSNTPTSGTPQGNLAGYGLVSDHGGGFIKSFTEHCLIIGLVSVQADLNYQQGLNRMWSRLTRFDFYWPALSHIGEQSVLNKEIYAQGTSADDDVFGYQERFAEYRYKPSVITGLFRSQAASSIDQWHLAQEFSSLPALNSTFIQDDPPLDRVIAVPSQPHLLLDVYFDMKTARPMPTYSVPGLIDHF